METVTPRIKIADYGCTVCQVCDGSLSDGRETTMMDGTETYHVRRRGFTYKRDRPVKRKIHTDCLHQFEERRQAAVHSVKVRSMTDLFVYMRDFGTPVEEIEQMMRDNTDLTCAEIEQIMASAG